MRLLLLNCFERCKRLIKEVMQQKPNGDAHYNSQHQADAQANQEGLLPPFDGGNDRCAAMRTRPRMVADLTAAFVAFD